MRGKGKVPSRPAGASGTATRLEAEHWLLSAETKVRFFHRDKLQLHANCNGP